MLIFKRKIVIYLILLVILSCSFFVNTKNSFAVDCSVKSATFKPSGEQTDSWYTEAKKPDVMVDITTNNCQGRSIEVSLTEEDFPGGDDDLPDSGLDNKVIVVPTSNHIVMHLKAGEEACEAGWGKDCNYYITVDKLDTDYFSSYTKPSGRLTYECEGTCLENWSIEGVYLDIPIGQSFTPPIILPPNPNEPTINANTTYSPLAPLPGLTEPIDTSSGDTDSCPFGKYLNIMIKIFLGVAGVLAVVMIVWGGIQYMTSELVSSKEAGKDSITHAILGLVVALGSFMLLNTLNPNLLNVCLNNLPKKEIEVSEENVTDVGSGININGATVKISKGSATKCSGGIVDIPNNIIGSGKICKDLLTKLQILKSKYPNWRITSTLREGSAKSSCHFIGFENSGNCADLQISSSNSKEPGWTKENGSTNTMWGDFCVAVAQVGGLNYLNEASKTTKCENIKAYKGEKYTSGPHLHVNFIGN